jgi:hypothetical protein
MHPFIYYLKQPWEVYVIIFLFIMRNGSLVNSALGNGQANIGSQVDLH